MISYAITAYNELDELKKLIRFLKKDITEKDEIVIQLDTKATNKVKEYANGLLNISGLDVTVIEFPLNNHFGDFKNNLNLHCTKEWIFQIDADEVVSDILITNIHDILKMNKDVDVILVPRVNTVEGLTEEDILQWGWKVNEDGWVNFPDYQWRLWKNKPEIKWVKPVHEQLTGFKTISKLPPEPEYSLIHPKTIDKQRKQNNFYREMF